MDYERFRTLHPEQEDGQAEERAEARHAGAEDAGAEDAGSEDASGAEMWDVCRSRVLFIHSTGCCVKQVLHCC